MGSQVIYYSQLKHQVGVAKASFNRAINHPFPLLPFALPSGQGNSCPPPPHPCPPSGGARVIALPSGQGKRGGARQQVDWGVEL